MLTEAEAGKYRVEMPAPSVPGSYPIDVSMKPTTGDAIEKKNVASLIVIPKTTVEEAPKSPTFSNLKAVTEGKRVTFSFTINDAPADLDKFKIAYGESADSLSQEITTFSSGRIQGT